MKKIIIALDGYSSCGKSSTAKKVAAELSYAFIDSGAMYRAVALYFIQHKVDFNDINQVVDALNKIKITFQFNPERQASDTILNGINVESEIRKMYISELVSAVSSIPEVRHAMVAQQQQMGEEKGIVMDGRDIGTVVFPKAEVKIFMTAEPLIRAKRRQLELREKGEVVPIDEILENLKRRDLADSTRLEGPLKRAQDAIELDTSYRTMDEQVKFVLDQVHAVQDGK
jgi:cytidylate kinase